MAFNNLLKYFLAKILAIFCLIIIVLSIDSSLNNNQDIFLLANSTLLQNNIDKENLTGNLNS
jgi:hypothetical protein